MEEAIIYGNGQLQYYWVSYNDGTRDFDTCLDQHPFIVIKDLNKGMIHYRINNWQQINCEEFNLWKDLNEK